MKSKLLVSAILAWCVMHLACNGGEMFGGSKTPTKPMPSSAKNSESNGTEGADSGASPVGKSGADGSSTSAGSSSASTSTPVTDAVTPDDVVDGMDVVKDCDRCFKRAQELTAKLGFTADMQKTINFGFYKIPPEHNLCDVHFMRDLFAPIADHDGQDSLLGDQVALYCPCDCGWATEQSYPMATPGAF